MHPSVYTYEFPSIPMIPVVRSNRLTERYLDIVTDGSSFLISQPFPDLFGNGGKSASASKNAAK